MEVMEKFKNVYKAVFGAETNAENKPVTEAHLAKLDAALQAKEDANAALARDKQDLEAKVSALSKDKQDLEAKVGTLEGDKTTLEAKVATLEKFKKNAGFEDNRGADALDQDGNQQAVAPYNAAAQARFKQVQAAKALEEASK
jgi:predicted component of type VI protein secretion system